MLRVAGTTGPSRALRDGEPNERYQRIRISGALLAVSIAALAMGASGCKKVDDANKDTTSSASSGVMSNSAGANGTSGESDAAKRASDTAAAGASGQSGSAASAASGVNNASSCQLNCRSAALGLRFARTCHE